MAFVGGESLIGVVAKFPEKQAISFPGWAEALDRLNLPARQAWALRGEIFAFLRHCRGVKSAATIALARQYLATRKSEVTTAALRWFVTLGQVPPGRLVNRPSADVPVPGVVQRPAGVLRPTRSAPPPRAAEDLGTADWERALIAAARRKGFLWRTEQTYREWASRFAHFIAPRSPATADEREVGAFLSSLAVNHRASQSTQKQALNALVFFMQEGCNETWERFRFSVRRLAGKCPPS